MPLNIDFQQIFLHLFNFVLLFAILYFLLYKPVKQFMERRTEYYKQLDTQANDHLADAEKAKAEYADRLAAVDSEIAAAKDKARREQDAVNALKKKQAEDEAAKIIANARTAAERERAKILKDAQNEIAEMVTNAAQKVVMGGTTSDAFDEFLATAQRGESNE